MAEPDFARDTAIAAGEDDGVTALFQARVADGWRAGLGPHGGYLAAILARALLATVDGDSGPPRSLTIHYLRAPQFAPLSVAVRRERRGRSLTSLSARMEQDGRAVALALAAFSPPWPGPEIVQHEMPDVEPPDPERRAGTLFVEGAPPFTRQITLQHRIGALPFVSPGAAMETGGWLGLARADPVDYPALAFFTDALVPTPFMHIDTPASAPTIDLTIHFRADLATLEPFDLCLAHARARLISEGFFEEDVHLWSPGGVLLAHSRQLAILAPPRT
ncbi:MAG TPA: thioesterase family protein [Solirubrobacteraceae bacterium]|nr:thioesterase family protein [Solirubrobacteraceae bacterium]